MSDILFIADFFVDQVVGGGELSNESLMDKLRGRGYIVRPINSHRVGRNDILQSKSVIVSNFINLSEDIKKCLESTNYVIYEHDHKYVSNRDPSVYPNFVAPDSKKINISFYQNACCVFVLSKICKKVMIKNIPNVNVYNIGCSLWEKETFKALKTLSTLNKTRDVCILGSSNPIKGYAQALSYCKQKNIKPEVIKKQNYQDFLKVLATCKNRRKAVR